MATAAVFIALGGGAYALTRGEVKSKHIAKNAVKAKQIRDGHVRSAELAAGAVGAAKIADGAIGAAKIADGAVGSAKIGSDQVGPEQIADVGALSAVGEVVPPGQTITLARNGPLTITGECRDQGGGSTEAQVGLLTTENGTHLIAITNEDPNLPGNAAGFGLHDDSDFVLLDAGEEHTLLATAGTTPGNGFALSRFYLAMTPGGSVLHGYVAGAPNLVSDGACAFAASGLG